MAKPNAKTIPGEFLLDPEFWQSVKQTAPNSLARLAQGVTSSALGAPVDIANMAMRPLGIGAQKPVLGSEHIAELLGAPTEDVSYKIGSMLPVGPAELAQAGTAAKAFAPALAAALGGTAIASKASEGAKLNALANVMRKERGIFAGVNAKTADLAKLEEAKQLAAQGVPDAEIWKRTGWTLDTPDKMPRFEIPDDAARLNLDDAGYLGVKHSFDDLGKSVSHEDLYSAYPEIKGYGGDISQAPGGLESGSFKAGRMSGKPSIRATGDDATGTVLHELQHAIQQREGFASGGSHEMMNSILQNKKIAASRQLNEMRRTGEIEPDKYELLMSELNSIPDRLGSDQLHQGYRRLAGEAEARLTQSRMNLTPEQRLAQYPYEPEYFEKATGVPLNSLIVSKGGDGTAMSLPAKTEFELAHEAAQRNAALPVEQGGLGLPPNNTAMDRAKAMGYPMDMYGKRHTNIGFTRSATNVPMEQAEIIKAELEQLGIPVRGEQAASGSTYLDIPGNPYAIAQQYGGGQSVPIEQMRFSTHSKRADGIPINEPDDSFIADVFPKYGNSMDDARKAIKDMIERGGIRSRFAAFDPMQRNSANILAGGAAVAIGLNALAPYLYEGND